MQSLKKIYAEISALPDLKPGLKTDKLFSSLVFHALHEKNSGLSKKELAHLQELCSRAEFELEKFWAQKILLSKSPNAALERFPYYTNYVKLTQLEWLSLLGCFSHKNHKVVFIGGGPLPLSAIVLAVSHKQKVTILEKDAEAFRISKDLIRQLNLSAQVKVVHADAVGYGGYRKFNTFFVAALAGLDRTTKHDIISRIQAHAPKGSHILARSSWGSRELLYKPLKTMKGLETIIEVRPHNDIVNSFFIFHV